MKQDLEERGEQGFMLVALVVAVFLVMLALAVAAPRMAQELKREREVEAVHRGDQYVRAIRVYYRKVGMYPGSIEQLEKTNNVRYLRQKYLDPMTGKADWRLIHVGEAKTTVKGFFGQPLIGLAATGPGGTSGATGTTGTSAFGNGSSGSSSSAFGSNSSTGSGSSSGSSAFGSSTGSSAFGSSSAGGSAAGSGSSAFGSTGTPGASGTATGTGNGTGSTSSSGTPSGGAPFMGVGLPVAGDSIIVLNEQTTYPTWEFIYDPRIEQLYQSAGAGGAAPAASSSTSAFGSPAGSSTGSSTFGSGTGTSGAFGSSTSGSGTTGSGSTPTTTPAPQQ